MLEFTIRGYNSYLDYNLGVNIGLAIINTFALIAYLLVVFYTRRIYKLSLFSNLAPWSGSNSKAIYFGFLAKIFNPFILGLDQTSK